MDLFLGTERNAILLVSFVWGLSEIAGSYVIPRLRAKGRVVKARSDRGSRMVIWLSIFGSIAIADFFGVNGITPLPNWFFYLGIALMLTGIILRQWSILILGRFFSTAVKILSDHKIVTNGPYQVIRHPAYTGSLLTLMGLGLASRTWGGTIVILAMFGFAYNYRISVEEKALKAEFGAQYAEYAKKTKRLIPFLL